MSPRVRPFAADDGPQLLDLWERAWTAALPAIDFAARRDWLADHLRDLQGAGVRVLVAYGDAQLLGFVTADPRTGALDQLAVAVEHQRRGVATLLIDAAKQVSPTGLRLSVNTVNTGAISLYRRSGFHPCGEGINARSDLPVIHMRWRP